MSLADSAGVPWAGRSFEPGPPSDDDGSAPAALIESLRRFRSGEAGEEHVVAVFRESRLLIPLLARLGEAGEAGETESGLRVDKSQELSIVTVSAPDGRRALPVFSSVATMAVWNPLARPVPAEGARVAVAAASEHTDLVVLDPGSDTEFLLRRPALWAIARSLPWAPSYVDRAVLGAFEESVGEEAAVLGLALAPGDPEARLAGEELIVRLSLVDGLDRADLDALVTRLGDRWAASELIAERVDSIRVVLEAPSD